MDEALTVGLVIRETSYYLDWKHSWPSKDVMIRPPAKSNLHNLLLRTNQKEILIRVLKVVRLTVATLISA